MKENIDWAACTQALESLLDLALDENDDDHDELARLSEADNERLCRFMAPEKIKEMAVAAQQEAKKIHINELRTQAR